MPHTDVAARSTRPALLTRHRCALHSLNSGHGVATYRANSAHYYHQESFGKPHPSVMNSRYGRFQARSPPTAL